MNENNNKIKELLKENINYIEIIRSEILTSNKNIYESTVEVENCIQSYLDKIKEKIKNSDEEKETTEKYFESNKHNFEKDYKILKKLLKLANYTQKDKLLKYLELYCPKKILNDLTCMMKDKDVKYNSSYLSRLYKSYTEMIKEYFTKLEKEINQ